MMMEAKFTVPVLVATLVFSGTTALTAEAPPVADGKTPEASQRLSTVFRCIENGNGFATIAQRGTRTTPPVITWNSKLGQYTPQERCNIVSQKLTAAVAHNGGKFKNLLLMAGRVNNQVVVCVVNNEKPVCNTSNTLFTLRPENARRPNEVIGRLRNFSVIGSGTPIAESDGLEPIPLEGLNQFLGSEEKTDSGTSSPSSASSVR